MICFSQIAVYRELLLVENPTGVFLAPNTLATAAGLPYSAPVTEVVDQCTVEEWTFINLTPDTHPMHMHLVQFEVCAVGDMASGNLSLILMAFILLISVF